MTAENYMGIDQEYIDLRNAIIKQAATDWEKAKRVEMRLKDKQRTPKQERKYNAAMCRLAELGVFFKGKWAKQLCGDVDPMMILGRLKDDERPVEAHKAVGQAH